MSLYSILREKYVGKQANIIIINEIKDPKREVKDSKQHA